MFVEEDEVIGGQVQAPTHESKILDGVLKKKSPKGLIKAWQERYTILTRDGLFYYKAKDVKEVKDLSQYQGAIPLRAIASIDLPPRKGFRFDITLEQQYGRIFSFTARTEPEVQKWVFHITLAWNERKDQDCAAGIVAMSAGPVGSAGGAKFRPLVPKVPGFNARNPLSSEMIHFLQSYKPPCKLINQPPARRPGIESSILGNNHRIESSVLGHRGESSILGNPNDTDGSLTYAGISADIFSDFKVESATDQGSIIGTIYLLGNGHYQKTHRSYLLHCVGKEHPLCESALKCIQTVQNLKFPLFLTPLYCGETIDTYYCIYHPPLRNSHNLLTWLHSGESPFPESVIQWILVHIIISLQLLHSKGVLFHGLSPEALCFDRDGFVRVLDPFLTDDVAISARVHNQLPEYDPPEVINSPEGDYSRHTTAGDFWRLGVLLYEISTGIPPFRDTNSYDNNHDREQVLHQVILNYKPETLQFPPAFSPQLKDLILLLLQHNVSKRLSSLDGLTSHPFLSTIDPHFFDIVYLITQAEKPEWILTNVIERLEQSALTPTNLTLLPDQPIVYKLVGNLIQCRQIGSGENIGKCVFNISLDGEQHKSPAYSLNNDNVNNMGNDDIREQFSFEFQHDTSSPSWGDLVVEIHVQKREPREGSSNISALAQTSLLAAQASGLAAPGAAPPSKSSTFFAVCTYPITQIRSLGHIDEWLTVYNVQTMEPCGEIRLQLDWETEVIDLSPALVHLTDSSRTFAQYFGKVAPPPGKKLSASILDQLANPYIAPVDPEMASTAAKLIEQQQQQPTNPPPLPPGRPSTLGNPNTSNFPAAPPPIPPIPSELPSMGNMSFSAQPPEFHNAVGGAVFTSDSFSHPPPVPPVPPIPPSPDMLPVPPPAIEDPEHVIANWKRTLDHSTQKYYWYNKITKSVSWNIPEVVAAREANGNQ